ncbi:hypothetical protein MSSIT_0448 [Methanosarcina siciliae T4/M]|uniref:Uncharacterized protein n=2 Tax=Methanosarcina siciliae TaxID=38027 RepID=A0A0E3P1C7_9EURY|nr:hypothetical protein MSSIT_0448 [Methanosarcina siciliae T4/M]
MEMAACFAVGEPSGFKNKFNNPGTSFGINSKKRKRLENGLCSKIGLKKRNKTRKNAKNSNEFWWGR